MSINEPEIPGRIIADIASTAEKNNIITAEEKFPSYELELTCSFITYEKVIVKANPANRETYVEKVLLLIIFQGMKIDGIIRPIKQPNVYSVYSKTRLGMIEESEMTAVKMPPARTIRNNKSSSLIIFKSSFGFVKFLSIEMTEAGEMDFIAAISLS